MSVVYIPIGPAEWHGPHLPFGMDPLNAEAVALRACARTGGIVWPTQFWGTERERSTQQLESLGFSKDEYVVGMDFPKNTVKSMYCHEEILAILVREILCQVGVLGAKMAVIVNGHGAENQMALLDRLTTEFNNTTPLKVLFRLPIPRKDEHKGSFGHAGVMETSLMMHLHPECVDLDALPALETPLKYTDYAIVDGKGFDGGPETSKFVPDEYDPRKSASAEMGRERIEANVAALAESVLLEIKSLK